MYLISVSSSRSLASSWAWAGVAPAVAADVQVPAVRGGDDADVLAAGLGAFAGTAGDAHLELVRAAQAAVAQLELDGHGHRVLHAEAAPGGADAALHGAQALAVGLAGLEPGVDESLPDFRELLQPGAEHVDALAAGDLRVQVVLSATAAMTPSFSGVISPPAMRGTTE